MVNCKLYLLPVFLLRWFIDTIWKLKNRLSWPLRLVDKRYLYSYRAPAVVGVSSAAANSTPSPASPAAAAVRTCPSTPPPPPSPPPRWPNGSPSTTASFDPSLLWTPHRRTMLQVRSWRGEWFLNNKIVRKRPKNLVRSLKKDTYDFLHFLRDFGLRSVVVRSIFFNQCYGSRPSICRIRNFMTVSGSAVR